MIQKTDLEAVKILSSPAYVGADENVLKNSMTGTFEYEKGDKRDAADFNVFFKDNATYPYYSDGIWFMTQMRRWGQITESKPAEWYAYKNQRSVQTRNLDKSSGTISKRRKLRPSRYSYYRWLQTSNDRLY